MNFQQLQAALKANHWQEVVKDGKDSYRFDNDDGRYFKGTTPIVVGSALKYLKGVLYALCGIEWIIAARNDLDKIIYFPGLHQIGPFEWPSKNFSRLSDVEQWQVFLRSFWTGPEIVDNKGLEAPIYLDLMTGMYMNQQTAPVKLAPMNREIMRQGQRDLPRLTSKDLRESKASELLRKLWIPNS